MTECWGEKGYVAVKREEPVGWAVDMVITDVALAVGIYRDPRDVYCSLIEFRRKQKKLTGKEQTPLINLIDALLWWKTWEPLAAYVTQYEGVDWAQEARNIGTLLGVEVDDAEDIAAHWSLEKNLERVRGMDQWLESAGHMLTRAHIGRNRGRSTWRETLTVDQAWLVERMAGKRWMEEHGYELSSN